MRNFLKNANSQYFPTRLLYPPRWIVLGVNNICNLHCKMCDVGTGFSDSLFYEHMMGAHPVNMPRELAFRIIDQISEFFPRARLGFAFTEPSIYPYLMESLEYAQSKNIFTAVTTNGLLLPKQADDFVRVGLNELNISLDGPSAIHNEIRGNRKSFEIALEGIEKIFSGGPSPITVSVFCAITQWNIGHLVEFTDTFTPFPLHQIGFLHTVFNTDAVAALHNARFGSRYPTTASNMAQISLDQYDLNALHEEIQRISSRSFPFPIHWSPFLHTVEQLERYYFHPDLKIGSRCDDVFHNLTIKSDGSVIPAHTRCYNVKAGNIYENTLKEIWNAGPLAQLRHDLVAAGGLFPACSRCCSGFAG